MQKHTSLYLSKLHASEFIGKFMMIAYLIYD